MTRNKLNVYEAMQLGSVMKETAEAYCYLE
jgi:hypothetical protein